MNITDWGSLTPSERCEGLIAFSESDADACSEEDFQNWIINYHRERLSEKTSVNYIL